MGAQLGHNSLGEGDVDSGEVVGKLRARFGVGRSLVFKALRCFNWKWSMKDAAPDGCQSDESRRQFKISGSGEARKQSSCSLAGMCWITLAQDDLISTAGLLLSLPNGGPCPIYTRYCHGYAYNVGQITRSKTQKKSPVTSLLVLCCIITKTGTSTFDFLAVLHTALFRPVAPFSGRCSCGDLSSHRLATCSQCDQSGMDIRKWK